MQTMEEKNRKVKILFIDGTQSEFVNLCRSQANSIYFDFLQVKNKNNVWWKLEKFSCIYRVKEIKGVEIFI